MTSNRTIDATHTFSNGLISTSNISTSGLIVNSVQIDTANAATDQALLFDGTKFAPGDVAGGVEISNTAPSSPSAGDLWFDSTDATTYVYYDSSWVAVGPAIPDQIGELIAAKGDLIVANTASTATRLPVGTNGYYLKANSSTSTGLEWAEGSPVYVTFTEVYSNYDVESGWNNQLIKLSQFSDSLIRIQTNSTTAIPTGAQISFIQVSGVVTTFEPQAGVTMYSKGSATKLSSQYAVATLVKAETDVWYLFGDIST
jgi:hypothetical protein